MKQSFIDHIDHSDHEAAEVIRKEIDRQKNTIELIASENIASPAVMAAQGSVLTNKYAERYPNRGIMVVASMSIRWKPWPLSGPNVFLAPLMPMSSPILAPRPTWPHILPCSLPAIQFWPWTWSMAAI